MPIQTEAKMNNDKLISLSSSSSEKTNSKTNSNVDTSSQTSNLISLTSNEENNPSKSANKSGGEESEDESSSIQESNSHNFNNDIPSPTSIDSDRLMLNQNILSLEGLEITSQIGSNYIDGSSPRPPTVDHDMQTSRRATMFGNVECIYGYHFPTSPTSSMISELAKQVDKANKPSGPSKNDPSSKILLGEAKANQLRRLQEMFPTATLPIIEQIIQIYNGREGLVKAALISLGYKRAIGGADKQVNTQNAIVLMMAKQSSRRLFDKLVGYFPDRDENTIKRLMYDLKEVEHEIISALVTTSPTNLASSSAAINDTRRKDNRSKSAYVQRQDRDCNNALMKLRFLKTLFPQSDETDLYNLLYCHNLDAQKVIQELEKQGHKPVNINQILATRKSKTQQAKAKQQASRAAKDRAPGPTFVELHKSRPKQQVNEAKIKSLKETIVKERSHSKISVVPKLIGSSGLQLEAQDNEDGRDKNEINKLENEGEDGHGHGHGHGHDEQTQQIDVVIPDHELIVLALTAAENDEILAKSFLDDVAKTSDERYLQRLNLNFDNSQQVVLYPCKGIQKSEDCDVGLLAAPEYISIPHDIVHCKTALALPKVDAATSTSDDFSDSKHTYRLGPKQDLAQGSKCYIRREKLLKILWLPEIEQKLAHGSNYKSLCDSTKRSKLAIGANLSLRSTENSRTQRQGRNFNLVQRIHPFYVPKFEQHQATNWIC